MVFGIAFFPPQCFLGVLVALGRGGGGEEVQFGRTQGHYRFSSLLFSVLLSSLPADFTFYDANGGCMVLSFSAVSWSVVARDIFNRI